MATEQGGKLLYPMVWGLVILTFATGFLFAKVNGLEKQLATGGGTLTGGIVPNPLPDGGELAAGAPGEPQQDLTLLPEVTKDDYVRGNRNAEVLLVEYSDYECPFCQRFHPVMEQVMKEYGNKVGWVFRHYPLSFHPKAQKSAEAAECAGEIGGSEAFWKLTDLIFENMPEMELADLPVLAKQAGVDRTKFQTCLDSDKYAGKIKDQQDGGSKTGVSGTPGTVIVGKSGKREFVPGALPFEQVKPLIDGVLEG